MIASEPLLLLPGPETPIPEAAELYARADLAPLALYGLAASGACQCSLGDQCPPRNRGKHPVGNAWQTQTTIDLDVVRDRFRHHRGNIGIHLAVGGYVVIDCDGDSGVAAALAWNLPRTLTARSGSGGRHYVYRLAPHHTHITDRRVDPAGIDVKTKGQIVVAPSRHLSGGVYTWIDCAPVATLPDDAYERIRKPQRPPAAASQLTPAPSSSTDGLLRRASAYLDKIPPAVAGSGGHDQTFAAGRALVGFLEKGLPESDCWNLLARYNATCQPPWSDKELEHKWADAKRAHTLPALLDRPTPHAPRRLVALPGGLSESQTVTVAVEMPDWRSELLWAQSRNGADKIISHVDNVVRILQLHPAWAGKIGYDAFRSRIMVGSDAPWDHYVRPTSHLGAWIDDDTTRLQGWFRRNFQGYGFDPSINDVERGVSVVAHAHAYNPLRDYLESVSWDATPRLATWLHRYLGTEHDAYHQSVGTWWLVAAVARVFRPGCKVDTVPILEGPQGLLKSSALKALAGAEYFSDTPLDLNSKDAYSGIQGCWFVELAELASLMRVDPSRSKAFFSSAKDRFRRAYARYETDELRQCVFVGTVNPPYDYLVDPSGARRFWPIRCERIDLPALEQDRDQLWAEAVARFQSGEVWYPRTSEESDMLEEPRTERTWRDAWESKVATYLQGRTTPVTTADVLQNGIGLDSQYWTPAAQTRVGIIVMQRLGWVKRRISQGGGRVWAYEPKEARLDT